MKPTSPHDPFDDLVAAALHGDLTPQERAAFEERLQNDPAAQAAYLETQLMHDLLEKTNRDAQPDPAFEQRMVSGVRRKIQNDVHPQESAWESVLILWRGIKRAMGNRWVLGGGLAAALALLVILALPGANPVRRVFAMNGVGLAEPKSEDFLETRTMGSISSHAGKGNEFFRDKKAGQADSDSSTLIEPQGMSSVQQAQIPAAPMASPASSGLEKRAEKDGADSSADTPASAVAMDELQQHAVGAQPQSPKASPAANLASESATLPTVIDQNGLATSTDKVKEFSTATSAPAASDAGRKLIRNAQLNLEVKNYQDAVDQVGVLTKAAGGYVDTSNSQRGGNGKLQGTVAVKILPGNLDDFLLKLRGLGEVKNQSVSTDDVTKDYFDTQARLENSRRMETQLQELLKRDNGKISELLQVERELGRVRGDIEQMQGELKVYDFQVQYATVTIAVQEKDLNQAAAYLLQERDDFSLVATDVEATFQQARRAADEFKAQVLSANLNHASGNDVSATLVASVPPEQIDAFLDRIRSLGRVANFTRQTNRVARDGGQTDQPADQTRTEKDRVQVSISVRSDDDARKQVAMTVVTPDVNDALDKAKAAALASPGATIMSSSLANLAQGQATAQISVRVPGKNYDALLASLRVLGRTSSFTLQRDDNAGPNAAGDDVPVIISLSLTNDETPLQQTNIFMRMVDVDATAQQLKKDAAFGGVEVKTSSFEHEPSGRETAHITFHLPLDRYPAFLAKIQSSGTVETLTIHRADRPDEARTDSSAPAEINLDFHNETPLVAQDDGIWATLRHTFGEGAAALLGSVRTIGVLVAFLAPWLVLLAIVAWVARRIYVSRRK